MTHLEWGSRISLARGGSLLIATKRRRGMLVATFYGNAVYGDCAPGAYCGGSCSNTDHWMSWPNVSGFSCSSCCIDAAPCGWYMTVEWKCGGQPVYPFVEVKLEGCGHASTDGCSPYDVTTYTRLSKPTFIEMTGSLAAGRVPVAIYKS